MRFIIITKKLLRLDHFQLCCNLGPMAFWLVTLGQRREPEENIASRSLRILYIFILRTGKVTTFEAKLERKW